MADPCNKTTPGIDLTWYRAWAASPEAAAPVVVRDLEIGHSTPPRRPVA